MVTLQSESKNNGRMVFRRRSYRSDMEDSGMRLTRYSYSWPSSRGFTMIELMVVVCVIAILMAITVPVYNRSRETARQATCRSNLHSIAIALRNYLVDNGEFPGAYNPTTGEGGISQLYLSGYLDSAKVLRCPDDVTNLADYKQIHVTAASWDQDIFAERYSSYNELFASRAYPLYNYYGYRGHDTCNKGWKSPAGTGPSDVEMLALDPDPTLVIGGQKWSAQVYTDSDHPYYESTTDHVVFDRNPTSTYARPLWDATANNTSAYFPGLINRNAPDNTIVTHCPWHREWFGTGLKERDLAVRLGGDTALIAVQSYDWVVQKSQ